MENYLDSFEVGHGIDRRAYERIRIGLDCLVFSNNTEISCKLKDVSEKGAGISLCDLEVGDDVEISFFDNSDVFSSVFSPAYIVSKGTVVRKSENDLGLRLFRSYELMEYLNNRQSAEIIGRMQSI